MELLIIGPWDMQSFVTLNVLIFKLNIQNNSLGTAFKFTLMQMAQNHIDAKSTLIQVMAWCCQATSYCLSQCWPISMLSYGISRPQGVKIKFNDFHSKVKHLIEVHLKMPSPQKTSLCTGVNVTSIDKPYLDEQVISASLLKTLQRLNIASI